MALPLIIILESMNWFSQRYSELLNCIRAFQEFYATASMGLFISVGAETHEGRKLNMSLIDTGIKAQLLIAPFPIIYNTYWEEIRDSPFLASYFEQFPSWKSYLSIRENTPDIFEWSLFIPSFFVIWARIFGDLLPFSTWANMLKAPYLFITPIKAYFLDRLFIAGGLPVFALQNTIAKFSSLMHSGSPVFISKQLCLDMHPLLDLEWSIMRGAILQLYVYDVILNRNPAGWNPLNLPEPYIPGQRFSIRDKGVSVLETEIMNSGLATLPIEPWINIASVATEEEIAEAKAKYPPNYVHVYQFDTHGIVSKEILAMGIADVIVHPTGDIPTEGAGIDTNADDFVTIAERAVTTEKRYQLAKVVVACDNAHKLQLLVAGTVRKRYNARKEDTFIMFYLYNEVILEGDGDKKIELKAKAGETGEKLYGSFYGEEEDIGG